MMCEWWHGIAWFVAWITFRDMWRDFIWANMNSILSMEEMDVFKINDDDDDHTEIFWTYWRQVAHHEEGSERRVEDESDTFAVSSIGEVWIFLKYKQNRKSQCELGSNRLESTFESCYNNTIHQDPYTSVIMRFWCDLVLILFLISEHFFRFALNSPCHSVHASWE